MADDDVDVFKPLANSLPWLIAMLREARVFIAGQFDEGPSPWGSKATLAWLSEIEKGPE